MERSDNIEELIEKHKGWYHINLPFLLALIVAIMSAFGYVLSQNARHAVSETKIANLEIELKTVKTDLKQDIRDIKEMLNKLTMGKGK